MEPSIIVKLDRKDVDNLLRDIVDSKKVWLNTEDGRGRQECHIEIGERQARTILEKINVALLEG